MDGVFSAGKFKRKEFDQVNDDFSEFSLSSPARKIRRLDGELLPPILEEEEPVLPTGFQQPELERSGGSNLRRGVVIEELPVVQDNEERALVVFKQHTPLVRSPTNYTVSPMFVSQFKNQAMWPNKRDNWRAINNVKEVEENKDWRVANQCLALVPWVPSQLPSVAENVVPVELESGDMMEAEDMEVVTMDIEESEDLEKRSEINLNDATPHLQQQQHCLVPQPVQNTSSPPVVWFQ